MLRENTDIKKKEIKYLKTSTVNQRFQSAYKRMFSDCMKCRKNAEGKDPTVTKTKKGKPMLLSKCAVCGSKKSRFTKEQ